MELRYSMSDLWKKLRKDYGVMPSINPDGTVKLHYPERVNRWGMPEGDVKTMKETFSSVQEALEAFNDMQSSSVG